MEYVRFVSAGKISSSDTLQNIKFHEPSLMICRLPYFTYFQAKQLTKKLLKGLDLLNRTG